ncbi:MAG: ANTAR domain-containing protein [Clostridia bacterium]
MQSALIISSTEKGNDFFISMLRQISCTKVSAVKTCGETRRLMMERPFDLYIINSPLTDETGENLSVHIATNTMAQVILITKPEHYDVISSKVEDFGVITVTKPINRHMFWSSLKLAKASYHRISKISNENNKLLQQIDDIKAVNRAKYVLIKYLSMTEPEAHKHIEKSAMDLRISKREVAQKILKTYQN